MAEALGTLNLGGVGEGQVEAAIDALLARESQVVREKGDSAFSQLMGEAMKDLRGRADGALVARVLKRKLDRALGG